MIYQSLGLNWVVEIGDRYLFTGGDDQGPVVPELFSLQMMLIADQGRSLKLAEIGEQCKSAGLKLQQSVPYPAPLPHTLCVAVKL